MKKTLYSILIVLVVLFFVGCKQKTNNNENGNSTENFDSKLVCRIIKEGEYPQNTEYTFYFDKNDNATKMTLKEVVVLNYSAEDVTQEMHIDAWKYSYDEMYKDDKDLVIEVEKHGEKDLVISQTIDLLKFDNYDDDKFQSFIIEKGLKKADYQEKLTNFGYVCD